MNNTHTTTAPQNPQPKFTEAIPEIITKLAELPAPAAAWDSGVRAYALRLLGILADSYHGKGYMPNNARALQEELRFGAPTWQACAWGGGAHFMSNEEICATLCNPTEQKATRHGQRKPNKAEDWADVSARAYSQAATLICDAARARGYFENAPAAVSLGLAKSRIRYCHDGSLRYPEGVAKNFIRFNSKVDAHGYGKRNICEVELTLTNTAKGLEFSVCGTVWNQQQTDSTLGGQCLDEMLTLARDASWSGAEIALLVEVVDLWRAHHLNGMHAGTPEQEKALENFSGDYSAKCEHLKALGLYEVEHEGKPYKYGHGWLYRPIPAADLARIWNLLNA